MPPASERSFRRLAAGAEPPAAIARAVAVERPVAIEFNGIGYAVMMATPGDLDDFATGFAFAERLVTRADQVIEIDHHPRDEGDLLRVTLAADCAERVVERARHRVSESSCGLCGIENLAVREDVGRHNAFDKLIGAMLRAGAEWDGGFALLSSRCSYELVEKAALAQCPQLVTISAPTSLAIARARDCGLKLTVLARPHAMLEVEA